MKNEATVSTLQQIGEREVLNAMPYGGYVADRDRTILFWSNTAEAVTGWTAGEVVGHQCDKFLIHVDKDGRELCGQPQCPFCRALADTEGWQQPTLIFARHKQGHRVPVELSVSPLRDTAGQKVGVTAIFRDASRVLEELQRARMIQDYILQSELPKDPRVHFAVRYRPKEIVGGDFYRVQGVGQDDYAIIVADTMREGLISALYTRQLRSILDECQADPSSPAHFIGEVNRWLRKVTPPKGYFATAVCLALNVASGQLRYAQAGHPAPALFRKNGSVELVSDRSPPLGLLEDSTYRETELLLERGDSLLLFTDGALSHPNLQGEPLGESGFAQLVQSMAEPMPDLCRIEKILLESGHGLRDDLTLLSIQLA